MNHKFKPSLRYTCFLSHFLILLSAAQAQTKPLRPSKPNSLDSASISFTVESAPEWTDLFYQKKGWFGGDGIFAISANGKEVWDTSRGNRITFWFSDTMFGTIEGDSLIPGYSMVHNSVAYLPKAIPDKNSIRFVVKKDDQQKPATIFEPHTPLTGKEDYYWLGDGFLNAAKKNQLYMFAYRIIDVHDPNSIGFDQVGTTLLMMQPDDTPYFTHVRQLDLPFFDTALRSASPSYGSAILVNTKEAGMKHADGYVYVYGVRGMAKEVLVARVKPGDMEDFKKWTFWNGKNWIQNWKNAAAIADHASNEMSVTALPDGRYVMVFQVDGIQPKVGMRLGAGPAGPFGPIIHLWDCKEVGQDKAFFSYNAKAHPVLSKPGELIISYNINSYDFFNKIKQYPNLYHPRFIRVKFSD